MYNVVKYGNNVLRNKTEDNVLISALNLLNVIFNTLGLKVNNKPLDESDKKIYKDWLLARTNKDFAKADEIRVILQEKGIM